MRLARTASTKKSELLGHSLKSSSGDARIHVGNAGSSHFYKNYIKSILGDPSIIDDNCLKCHHTSETIQHITEGCTSLAPTEYLQRHNCVGRVFHQRLAFSFQLIQDTTPYYHYSPNSMLESKSNRGEDCTHG